MRALLEGGPSHGLYVNVQSYRDIIAAGSEYHYAGRLENGLLLFRWVFGNHREMAEVHHEDPNWGHNIDVGGEG